MSTILNGLPKGYAVNSRETEGCNEIKVDGIEAKIEKLIRARLGGQNTVTKELAGKIAKSIGRADGQATVLLPAAIPRTLRHKLKIMLDRKGVGRSELIFQRKSGYVVEKL